jgi:hypothetical protein
MIFAAGRDGLDLRAALASGMVLCIAGADRDYRARRRGQGEVLPSWCSAFEVRMC